MLEKIKNQLEGNNTMREFLIGIGLGLIIFFIQLQYGIPIESWLWIIGIIAIIYMGLIAFIPVLASVSFGFVGFLVGVMISLFIWTFLLEFQKFFSSFFG